METNNFNEYEDYIGDFIDLDLMNKINKHILTNYSHTNKLLPLDYNALEKFDPALADLLVSQPEYFFKLFEDYIKNLNKFTSIGNYSPKIIIENLPILENFSKIHTQKSGNLIKFSCIVISKSPVRTIYREISYKCAICDTIFKEKRKYPQKGLLRWCNACKKNGLKEMQDSDSHDLVNIQFLEVQEQLEKSKGINSDKIKLVILGDLVQELLIKVQPGDNIKVTGILFLEEANQKNLKELNIKNKYILVNNIEVIKKDFEDIEITQFEEKKIIELSKMEDLEYVLVNSIASDVYGYYEIKKALLLQLLGGTKNKKSHAGKDLRDTIHVLLMGDPGVAKSKFLNSVEQISPKSIRTDGSKTTGVGLTCSAGEKNEFGDRILRAGALILASGGMVQLDELDKLNDENKYALLESMQDETVSIAKAGIVAKFITKTAILAAANPKHSSFDKNKPLIDQFNFPSNLLSRFDLIFAVVDDIEQKKDKETAEHILKIHSGIKTDNIALESDFVKKYISYARKNIQPKMTDLIHKKIVDYYLLVRLDAKNRNVPPITPRMIEILIRLSEANAKMRLSNIVEEKDVDQAVTLFGFSLDSIARDEKTGQLDYQRIQTGMSVEQRKEKEKVSMVKSILKNIFKEYDLVGFDELRKRTADLGILENELKNLVHNLLREGFIYEKNKDEYIVIQQR